MLIMVWLEYMDKLLMLLVFKEEHLLQHMLMGEIEIFIPDKKFKNSQKEIVRCFKSQVGKPYVYGAAGPNSFDYSGLAYYCHGKSIPRVSSDQARGGIYVSKSNLQPGDLMFWDTEVNGTVGHTTIYIGNGKMIHAPQPGEFVKETSISGSYWDPRYVTARRYWS